MLHIESEALHAGQRDTFLLLQEDDARRQQLGAALYDWFQAAAPSCAGPTIEVQQAVVVEEEAWVWLSEQRTCGNRRQDLGASWVAHFHLSAGLTPK